MKIYNIEVKVTIPEEIKEWAFWLSSGILGKENLPLCPWAKKSILEGSVDYWENDDIEALVPLPPEIKVRIVSLPGKNIEEILEIRDECARKFTEWIFLESHPEDPETIGGIRSVFKSPLILIQSRKELEEAREFLKRGNYYSYWDSETLERMFSR
jgi:hypothetical protein